MFGLSHILLEERLNKQHDMIIKQAASNLELANIITDMFKEVNDRVEKLEIVSLSPLLTGETKI